MTNIASMKLYHYPATRSVRVRWLMHELMGDDFTLERVPLYDGAQYGADYLRKNPNHCVPTLELITDTGESHFMLESGAMVALLADAYPDRSLAPAPAPLSLARADYLQALHFASTWADMMLWQIRLHEHLLPEAERDARTAARYRAKFQNEVEPQLLSRLERHAFACGEAFSAADCVIGHDVLWARAYGMCQHPTFERYVAALAARPAFLRAVSDLADFTLHVPADKQAVHALFTG